MRPYETTRGDANRTRGGDPPALQRLRHDLRQPLAAIRWSLDGVLGNEDLPVDVSSTLHDIGRQTRWMERLLAEMLDAPSEVLVVDLAGVVAACCSATAVDAPYDVRFEAGGEARVLVDPVGLERVDRNILDNAVRAVSGSGRIDVRVTTHENDAIMEVADSGPGFGRLKPRHGHGLVGARRFVDRFGGELACETSSLGGALVRMSLPRAIGW
jgi:two-component system sensor histidine kinase MprB